MRLIHYRFQVNAGKVRCEIRKQHEQYQHVGRHSRRHGRDGRSVPGKPKGVDKQQVYQETVLNQERTQRRGNSSGIFNDTAASSGADLVLLIEGSEFTFKLVFILGAYNVMSTTEFPIPSFIGVFRLSCREFPGFWAATAASYCPSRPCATVRLIATEYTRTQGAAPPCRFRPSNKHQM